MNRIQYEEGLNEPPDPYQWLDVIAGVDTAALRLPIHKANKCFKKLGDEVYSNKKGISKSVGSTEYKTTKLKQTLKEIIRNATRNGDQVGNEDETMMESPDPECKIMILAMSKHNMNAGIPTIFRSYHVTNNRMPDCTIWEAICASMAHPEHFNSVDIGEAPMHQSFVTGTLGCSNPTAHVLDEVKQVYPNRHVSCIIVVGGGHAKTIHIPEPTPLSRILIPTDPSVVGMSIAMDAERVAREMEARFRGTPDVYFRLSVEQGMQALEAHSWDQLGRVLSHTRTYMRQKRVDTDIDKIVKAMRERMLSVETSQIDGQIRLPNWQKDGVKDCPDPTPVFTGRSDKIELIERCIANGNNRRCVFVLHGLGGAGKTQIALKTVQKTLDMWSDIVYVDATTQDTAVSALAQFAKAKSIGGTHTDTIKWLGAQRERWLVVFDNVDDPSLDIRSFFPSGNHGSILITTRISQLVLLAQGPGPECAILSMYPEEALHLLLKTARMEGRQLSKAEQNAAARLLQDCGHLALAIVHAGAYICCSKRTFSQYYSMFLSQRQETLNRYNDLLAKVDSYQKNVYTTWFMSYKLLSNRAQRLMWLMAFIHHDKITEDMFRRAACSIQTYEFPIPPSDAETEVYRYIKDLLQPYLNSDGTWHSGAFLAVMTELMAYSLISYDQVNDAYTLHVLVHDWISTVVPSRAAAIEHTAFLLAVSICYEPDSEGSYAHQRALEAHVSAVLRQQAEPRVNNAALFAQVYSCVGRWRAKESLDRTVLEARKRTLGLENAHTLISMSDLATTYTRLGQYKEAEALQLQVLETRKRVFGDDHYDTLNTIHDLAQTYRDMGLYEDARVLQEQDLEGCKRVHGADHPDTLSSMHGLALTYQYMGRYKDAEKLQLQVLGARKRVSGGDHPDTLSAMHNLATTYEKQGRYRMAESLLKNALDARKRLLGENHPQTLNSIRSLSAIYHCMDRFTEAEALLVQALKAFKRVFGDNHPDTLICVHDLAAAYRKLGRYEEAEVLQEQSLEVCKETFGNEHPNTLASMHNLAVIWQLIGRHEEAEAMELQVVALRKQVLGSKHPHYLSAIRHLAEIYQSLGSRRWDELHVLEAEIEELEG
ncbi:hypothetical protein FRC09_011936 [Ceratobasidium sp. 395]|nr:hypothetical protein FRC09_011936 [Ceratobasidium sp. 395]